MKRFRWGIRVCSSLLAAVLLQMLLCPKYVTEFREGALTGEYYAHAGGNDVIFLGDCEVYENFSPIALWENYGITSYIRGSAQQTVWQSYYILEETFRYEVPKVVVFNVLAMQYDTPESTGNAARREAYNRMTLDTMRWSSSKWNAILASTTEEERQWDSMFTYLFPILRYHDRWETLTEEDVTYWFRREEVAHNGYLMQTAVKPYTERYASPPLTNPEFGENAWNYLNKIVALCWENGVELVLIKAPSQYPVWWEEWDRQIREYAGRQNLRYLNLLEFQQEIGIDWNQDTYDAGLHLNVSGAEKASVWLGEILAREYDLSDHRENGELAALWQKKTEKYEAQKERETS